MSRNNEKNIRKHNNKLHKEQDRVKNAEILQGKIKTNHEKFYDSNNLENN
jgi:hypothetical protein